MKKAFKVIGEYLAIIGLVIFIRIFIVTPIEVNGRSMEETLYDNDIMLLNILGYHLKGIERFDIVVIKHEDEHLIKRVIGLPGESVRYVNGKLYINGVETNDIIEDNSTNFTTEIFYKNGIIPENHYFVLGDNRDNSSDSRVIGLIEKKDILGKARLILFPFKHFGNVK